MRYTDQQREALSLYAPGKMVQRLYWENESPDGQGGYWVMLFTDGSEISFRFMAELLDNPTVLSQHG